MHQFKKKLPGCIKIIELTNIFKLNHPGHFFFKLNQLIFFCIFYVHFIYTRHKFKVYFCNLTMFIGKIVNKTVKFRKIKLFTVYFYYISTLVLLFYYIFRKSGL